VSLLKRADPEAEIEAQRQRVHGVERTCAMCGTTAPCDPTEVVYRRTLAGDDVLFGRCRACCQLGDHWQRGVAAALLRLDPDSLLLDDLTVERFIDRPGADPSRPNSKPWGHVGIATLTKQAERAQHDLDLRHGPSPCGVCGSTLTPRGTTWTTQRGSKHPLCARCDEWVGAANYGLTPDGVRIVAAAVLLGRATPTLRPHGPPGLAEQIGLTTWAESGLSRGGTEPWSWLDVAAINERLASSGSTERVDIARWLLIDRTLR